MFVLGGYALDMILDTSFVDEIVVDQGVVVDYFVAGRQNEDLFFFVHPFPFGDHDFNVGQGLTERVVSCFVAQGNIAVLFGEGLWVFEGDPFWVGLCQKVQFVDGGSVFFAVPNLQIEIVVEV